MVGNRFPWFLDEWMAMTCLEFDQAWQDRLDGVGSIGFLDEHLAAHAVSCADCRARDERYRLLAESLPALARPPQPSADLVERVLSRYRNEPRPLARSWRRPSIRVLSGGAVAAAILIAVLGAWPRGSVGPPRPVRPAPRPTVTKVTPRSATLSDATIATVELALASSLPAARLGRILIETASAVDHLSDEPGAAEDATAGRIFRTVGGRVATGIRPISGQARRAFNFLLNSVPAEDSTPPSNGSGHGA